MKRRMNAHDYTCRGIYMVTLAVEGRRALLCSVDGTPKAPVVTPTALGTIVLTEVEHIALYYPQVRVLCKQLMPDHLHMVLFVTDTLPAGLGRVINGFKAGCRKALRAAGATPALAAPGTLAPHAPAPHGPAPHGPAPHGPAPHSGAAPNTGTPAPAAPTSAAPAPAAPASGASVGGVEWQAALQPAGVAAPAACGPAGGVLWEHGYNDRVLYGEGQLQAMIAYVKDNPRRLLVKRAHAAFFRHAEVWVDGRQLHAFGNVSLLRAREKVAVRCSRRQDAAELQRQSDELLKRGRNGAVLVSPFISPGERSIEQNAMDADIAIIKLTDNAFTPYYKPPGRYFEACAEGRLLLLSPWPYTTQRVTLTRDMCNTMNTLAARICHLPATEA